MEKRNWGIRMRKKVIEGYLYRGEFPWECRCLFVTNCELTPELFEKPIKSYISCSKDRKERRERKRIADNFIKDLQEKNYVNCEVIEPCHYLPRHSLSFRKLNGIFSKYIGKRIRIVVEEI